MIGRDGEQKIRRIADMIRASRRVVVFTGAGVSTASGIPDFRSPGGLWSRFDPEDFTIERFLASPETRRKQWRFLIAGGFFTGVEPNAGHRAIAELEALGRIDCVITQNIDNLHQRAGSDPGKVYELHGNMRLIRCLACGERTALEEIVGRYGAADAPPACESCGGILKPDVIFFGEALPERTLEEAMQHARRCDLLIVVGSSLVVYPAAGIPFAAEQAGARLAIVNLSPTPADPIADVVINSPAAEVLPRIVAAVKGGPA